MFITVGEKTLTDNSMVFHVDIRDEFRPPFNCIRLEAITYNDAKELAAKIAEAIEAHTINSVESDH